MDTSNRPPLSALAIALFTVGLSTATGCTNAVDAPMAGVTDGASAVTCDDVDEDGFGPGCVNGEDCDDENADVTSECYRCAEPGPGCPCAVESSTLYCEYVLGFVGTQKTCGPGYATCNGGVWGECILNYTAKPATGTAH